MARLLLFQLKGKQLSQPLKETNWWLSLLRVPTFSLMVNQRARKKRNKNLLKALVHNLKIQRAKSQSLFFVNQDHNQEELVIVRSFDWHKHALRDVSLEEIFKWFLRIGIQPTLVHPARTTIRPSKQATLLLWDFLKNDDEIKNKSLINTRKSNSPISARVLVVFSLLWHWQSGRGWCVLLEWLQRRETQFVPWWLPPTATKRHAKKNKTESVHSGGCFRGTVSRGRRIDGQLSYMLIQDDLYVADILELESGGEFERIRWIVIASFKILAAIHRSGIDDSTETKWWVASNNTEGQKFH